MTFGVVQIPISGVGFGGTRIVGLCGVVDRIESDSCGDIPFDFFHGFARVSVIIACSIEIIDSAVFCTFRGW